MKQKRRKMYLRMVTSSLLRRRSRMIIALLAIAIGAAILTGLLTIYYDVPRQLGAQFRNYGANMILQPTGEYITTDEADQAVSLIDSNALVGAAGYRYQTTRIHEQPVNAAGVDMEQAQKTAPYWNVDGEWPSSDDQLMVGAEVADDLYLRVGDSVDVSYTLTDSSQASDGTETETEMLISAADTGTEAEALQAGTEAETDIAASGSETEAETAGAADSGSGSSSDEAADADVTDNVITFTVCGILSTGGSEEKYVYMTTGAMNELTQDSGKIDIVELSVSGSSDQLNAYMDEINGAIEGLHASLVKRITASETTVLSKLQYLILLVTIVVLALTLISVGTTMTATVTERRQEIGLKKAMGASDKEVIGEFMGETLLLGAVGGLLGGFLGFGFAQIISVSVFASSISFRPLILPIAIAASLAVTVVSCMIPIRRAISIKPALVLKGE